MLRKLFWISCGEDYKVSFPYTISSPPVSVGKKKKKVKKQNQMSCKYFLLSLTCFCYCHGNLCENNNDLKSHNLKYSFRCEVSSVFWAAKDLLWSPF